MKLLDRKLLKSEIVNNSGIKSGPVEKRPERVLQFGEGNFLRAFFDWMLSRMNSEGLFNGSAVIIQPIKQGKVEDINRQDAIFTVILGA